MLAKVLAITWFGLILAAGAAYLDMTHNPPIKDCTFNRLIQSEPMSTTRMDCD
jgi:hypothetical protein